MVPLESSAFFDQDPDTSLRYEIEIKTELSFESQLNLERALKNILKFCPPNCCLRAEISSVREEYGINLEFVGLAESVDTFVLGQDFDELLNELEEEAILHVTPSNSWDDQNKGLAV